VNQKIERLSAAGIAESPIEQTLLEQHDSGRLAHARRLPQSKRHKKSPPLITIPVILSSAPIPCLTVVWLPCAEVEALRMPSPECTELIEDLIRKATQGGEGE